MVCVAMKNNCIPCSLDFDSSKHHTTDKHLRKYNILHLMRCFPIFSPLFGDSRDISRNKRDYNFSGHSYSGEELHCFLRIHIFKCILQFLSFDE